MPGYTADEKLRIEQITKLRRQWLKDQELSPREPVLPKQTPGPVARFWTRFLEPKSLWRIYTHKAYTGGVFALTRYLIPIWVVHYYVKYHVDKMPYGIVMVKPRLFPGDTILETGETFLPWITSSLTITMAAAKMSLQRHKRRVLDKASEKTSKHLSAEASPDSKCPICLDKFNNMSYLDLCLHKFCFRCIHEWSKNKAECPLCKQPFNSIYHSIKSDEDFKKHDLRPTDNGSFGSFAGERFRYRTTLTGPRRHDQRWTSSPPDNGVMFEALAGDSPSLREGRGFSRMVARLAARRRAESEGRAMRALREQEMIEFRRAMYRRGARVRSVRDGGRSRDISAEFLQRNPACLHRLLPWLKRELVVLYGAHGSLVNIVQHVIMSRITRYDMENGAIREELQPFLQARTDHFLHEFINFARSPFNLEAYDQHAVYDCPASFSDEEGSHNSSVIAISEDDEENDSVDLNPPGDSVTGGALSQTPWDDETPGPSYSATESARALLLSIVDSDSESSVSDQRATAPQLKHPHTEVESARVKTDKDKSPLASSGDEDCMIVGFVKPLAERTPELVKLSSDSEESVLEGSRDKMPGLPQHIRFTSVSPVSRSPCPRRSEELGKKQDLTESKGRLHASPLVRQEKSKRHKRDDRRRVGRDRSGERRSWSRERRRRRHRSADRSRSTRSPAASVNSTLPRGRRPLRSRSRERSHTKGEKRSDSKDGGRSGHSHDSSSHSIYVHYYSRGRERDVSAMLYGERRSRYFGSHADPRSRSQSRDSQPRDARRSWSRSSSPAGSHRKSHREKPGGKRKYKTRHLEEPPPTDRSSEVLDDHPSSAASFSAKDKTRPQKTSREKRSRSVEIVYEGSPSRKHNRKKKKKHKKKSRKNRSKERLGSGKHSPIVITIDSDSDPQAADVNQPCDVSSTTGHGLATSTTPTITGNPADSSLLEFMLQGWEQEIPSVGMDGGVEQDVKPVTAPPADKADNDNLDVAHGVAVQSPSASGDELNSHSLSRQ
ncbi:hypothetical protein UPYG_G00046620 [Umbra pygmaea]|uniref:E3 ubiquitin-protein ligase Topors n=1 Tax=Umbra pygmaea TaxID=75934 RepID=A0ABD0XR44_UMBPY